MILNENYNFIRCSLIDALLWMQYSNILLYYYLAMRHYYVCSVNGVFAYRKKLPKMDILNHFPYFQAILYSVCLGGNLNILYLNINISPIILRPVSEVEEGEAEVNFSYKFQDYAKTLGSDKLSLISEQENSELRTKEAPNLITHNFNPVMGGSQLSHLGPVSNIKAK